MSRTRYEPVPQREETIDLESLSNYNYNSALPNSVPSSTAPSSIAPSYHREPVPSIPGSPPPSFHTISSPGTPRPNPSIRTNPAGQYAELWGVAPSTVGAQTDVCAASDALATIAHLKARIERLEESLGQLLLDKEERGTEEGHGGNCCMTFTDASPALERTISTAGGNCCITFLKSSNMERERQKQGMLIWLCVAAMACLTVVLVTFAKAGKGSKSN